MTQFRYISSNEEALKEAKALKLAGKRVEIISDEKYALMRPKLVEEQSLIKWAQDNGVEYSPST